MLSCRLCERTLISDVPDRPCLVYRDIQSISFTLAALTLPPFTRSYVRTRIFQYYRLYRPLTTNRRHPWWSASEHSILSFLLLKKVSGYQIVCDGERGGMGWRRRETALACIKQSPSSAEGVAGTRPLEPILFFCPFPFAWDPRVKRRAQVPLLARIGAHIPPGR